MSLMGVKGTHLWLDSRMRVVGYAPIQSDASWRDARVLLGPAVNEVIKQLQLNPPANLQFTDDAVRSLQRRFGNEPSSAAVAASGSRGVSDAPPAYDSVLNIAPVDMPPIPTEFAQLEGMSRERLQKLLDDGLEFKAFAGTLSSIQTLDTMKGSIMDECAKGAQKNLETEASYMGLHAEVTTLSSALQEKLVAFKKLEGQQSELCEVTETQELIRQLNKGKRQALDESEEYAEDWIEGGGDVDEFVKKFLAKRKVHHERAAKIELLRNNNGREL